jgi:adenylate cyclase
MFGKTLENSPAVLAAYARDGVPKPRGASPVNIIERASKDAAPYKERLHSFEGASLPLPVLAESAPAGVINIASDYDGVIRQIPLVVLIGGDVYPSLALRTFMRALGTKVLTVGAGPNGIEYLKAGSYAIPVSRNGSIHIPFSGPRGTYDYVSASDVLKGDVDPEFLAGRVAFVGTSAAGLMDIRATPLDSHYPGVETHAAILDAIISGNVITVPAFTPGIQALAILAAGFLSAAVFGLARPRTYIPVGALLISAAILASRSYFSNGVFISPLYVSLTVGIMGASMIFLRFWQEEKKKLVLRNAFSRYVSPEVVRRIARQGSDLFAGEERELSIIFTDIRGFTTISEKLTPNQTVRLLNRYFTPMTAIVLGRGGTLDKFIGDALMAFWNAPLDVQGHPALAVEAAMDMQAKLTYLNEELVSEFGTEIRIGAGIHTGLAYVGNMGSEDLVNYTLIGDNVNLASRIEGLCPQYGVRIVASADTMKGCGDKFMWQYIDTINVKGKTLPVSVYTPISREEGRNRASELSDWDSARGLYLAGKFAESVKKFQELQKNFPEMKLYGIYAERAQKLLEEPPDDWSGVWTLKTK